MSSRPLTIAQIGSHDEVGGASIVADALMRGYRRRGHQVTHLVGWKRGDDPDVRIIPDDDRAGMRVLGYTAAQRLLRRLGSRFPNRGFGAVSRSARLLTHPRAAAAHLAGLEDFEFPSSHNLLARMDAPPDIVHAHNLHGGFFDLRALSGISKRAPLAVTLHDMWMLTGHCAYSIDCHRWQSGCGQCPHLGFEPALRRDGTAENWRRKQAIFSDSRLHVATPSAWLHDRVHQSMLAPAIVTSRVIPNGVDTAVFHPADRAAARRALGLPGDPLIVMVTTGSRGSMWKDDPTLREMIHRVIERPLSMQVVFAAVGRESAIARTSPTMTIAIPYQQDRAVMARYYQAADLYVHSTRADTFPLTVLEAMACGTPVIATAVDGVVEQLRSASIAEVRADQVGDATGMLVTRRDSEQMATAVEALLANPEARARMARNAVADVQARFTLERQVDTYLDWYREILDSRGSAPA